VIALSLLLACTDEPTPPVAPCEATATFGDASNYTFAGDLQITSQQAQSLADVQLDVSALTRDLRGLPVDPAADLGQISALLFDGLTQAELEVLLAEDTLQQSAIGFFAVVFTGGRTSVALSELGVLGNPIDLPQYFVQDAWTWLLMTSSGTIPGKGMRMIQFIEARDDAVATSAAFTDGSATLTLDVDLGALTPVPVRGGVGVVDWSTLTLDARGRALDPTRIDTITLARYDDRPFEGLEEVFLQVDAIADATWTGVPVGASIDLTTLTGATPFEGIDDDATWALALQCSRCTNPAPLAFTQLTRCDEGEAEAVTARTW
jgi:hypothetical protein